MAACDTGGHIALLREAQLAAVTTLNNTGTAIAADLSDPSGMWHPVHPPYVRSCYHYHTCAHAFLPSTEYSLR